VILSAIALFFPLAYLFFDLVLLSDRLFFGTPAGGTYLSELMRYLSDVSFATNTPSELTEATFGEAVATVTAVSPFSILPAVAAGQGELAPLLLPVAVTVVLALGCAAGGVLLILTGGRILRLRLYRDLTLLAGAGATFAPLLSTLILRVTYCLGQGSAVADERMRRVLPSVEALCIMGILVCALLPALAALREMGARAERAREHVGFPFRPLEKLPFGLTKALLLSLSALAMGLIGAMLFVPTTHVGTVMGVGNLRQAVTDTWNSTIPGLAAVGVDGATVDHFALGRDLMRLTAFLGWGFLLLSLLFALCAWLRVLFAKKDPRSKTNGAKRALKELPDQLRAAALAPFAWMVVVQSIHVCLLLFASPIAAHMDFSSAAETFDLIYLVMCHARTMGTTTTLYSFLAAAAALLWYGATQCARALLNHYSRSANG
jgi:hypothetical protein